MKTNDPNCLRVLLNAEAGLLGFSSSKSDEVSTVRPGSKSLKINSGNKFWRKKIEKILYFSNDEY